MKRFLGASLLALLGLGLGMSQASADWCVHLYRPCIKLPVPAIPILCPKFSFFCESCNVGCCPTPGGPWWDQFPSGGNAGYSIAPYGGFTGSYGGVYGSYSAPVGAWGGYGQPSQAWGGYQQ